MGLKVELSNVVITLYQVTHLLFETMQGILRFIIFTWRREKHFLWLLFGVRICLMLRFCWLQSCQYAKIVNYYSDFRRWAQVKVFAASYSSVELLHFSVLDKFSWVKCFSLFISTYIVTQNYLCLWLNVL